MLQSPIVIPILLPMEPKRRRFGAKKSKRRRSTKLILTGKKLKLILTGKKSILIPKNNVIFSAIGNQSDKTFGDRSISV